ncbi:hypothetical protein KVT40_003141 [Elsinoe batatas]|uniref:F-box domain-containing protein n=1 Tax=Elsinoe batatas TaxID=2601811 RepID=A0A8K0L3J7_9PEZI|nr:hypothetical protein KVT40_003141 [Elsinoe batatas]
MAAEVTAAAKLPFEVKCMIAEALKRPSDLARLCRVSNTWYDAGIRKLYRHVRFDIGVLDDVKLMATTLNLRNRGLRYVRTVELGIAAGGLGRQVDATISAILDLLPKDSIERFRWRSWVTLSRSTLRKILLQQTKMSTVQAFHADHLTNVVLPDSDDSVTTFHDFDGGDLLESSCARTCRRSYKPTSALQHCKKLRLCIQSEESFEISRIFLSECQPRDLTIRIHPNDKNLRFMSALVAAPQASAQPTNYACAFVERLCDNLDWHHYSSSMQNLGSLTLVNADLINSSIWVRMIPFTSLHTLRFCGCSDLEQFISYLETSRGCLGCRCGAFAVGFILSL